MSARILLVDDYAEWNRHVSVKLQNDLRYRVIGEVTDGLDALPAAKRLQPDLVVLDIGLPRLNGIEVARRLLDCSPQSRILFLTENRCPEIAAAAIATGAYGYVVKSDATTDLLPAIGAIADGQTFVSPRLADSPFDWTTVRRNSGSIRHHDVMFSSDEPSMIDGFARFVGGHARGRWIGHLRRHATPSPRSPGTVAGRRHGHRRCRRRVQIRGP